jgi:SAM-dependent methyltransferase
MVVATDMYIDNWAKDGLANPSMLTEQHKFSPIPFPKERLRVLKMDALNLEFPSNHFDFTWSVGSIEHFGSSRYRHALWIALRKSGLRDWASKFAHIGAVKAVKEMARVLKPGGIAAITTEVILNGCPHHEFFLPNEILQFIITPSGMELIDNEIEYHPSNYFMENILPKNMWDSTEMPQVVLRDQRGTEFTSISLFLRKKGL